MVIGYLDEEPRRTCAVIVTWKAWGGNNWQFHEDGVVFCKEIVKGILID